MHKIVPLTATGLALVLGLGLFVASQAQATTVQLNIDGQTETVPVTGRTVAEVLLDRKVVLGVHDTVAPELAQPITKGTQITVRYGRPIAIVANGQVVVRWTTATDVTSALAALNLRVSDAALSVSRSLPIGRQGFTVTLPQAKGVVVVAGGKSQTLDVAGHVLDAINAAGVVLKVDDKVSVPLDQQLTDGLKIVVTGVADAKPKAPAPIVVAKPDPNLTPAEGDTCIASIYTDTQTASGQPYRSSAMAAAHKTLPFGTQVKVTNLATGATTIVTINDRGPYVSGRCLDLTPTAFSAIAPISQGLVKVAYEVV